MGISSQSEKVSLAAVSATVLAISGALALAYVRWKRKNEENEKRLFPVAPVGMFEAMKELSGPEAPLYIWEISKKMKETNIRFPIPIGPDGIYYIGDCELTKQICLDPYTDKPKKIYATFEGAGEPTLFTLSTNAYVKAIRKATAHAFSKKELERMNTIAIKYADEWINGRLKKFAETGEPFDPDLELQRLTFFSILEAAFEYEASENDFKEYQYNTDVTFREFTFKQISNPLRKIFGLFIPEVRKALHCSRERIAFARKVLDAYRKNPNKSPQNTLIKIFSEATCFTSEAQREAEMTSWIFAGEDTTGYTMAHILRLLAKHPDEQKKLCKALLLHPDDMNAKDIPEFLHVKKESVRMFPVGGSIRETGKDFPWKDGKVVPKGSICFFSHFLIFRNPDLFDHPEEFRPQRWENPSTEMENSLMYFGLGPRNCPGQYLATAEINSFLPRILKQYSFELVDEGSMDYFITLKFKDTKLRATKL